MNARGIIIEGVTGAGKSSTLKALLANELLAARWSPYDVYREKETFGEFMGELLGRPDAPLEHKFRLLRNTIHSATARAGRRAAYRFIMERVHYSYYALLPDWDLYEAFDEQLARLNPHVFLLWISDACLKTRSFVRSERPGWAQGFIRVYGSEAAAMEAIRSSQNARYEAMKQSAIPHTVIDTSAMEWERYAAEIVEQMA